MTYKPTPSFFLPYILVLQAKTDCQKVKSNQKMYGSKSPNKIQNRAFQPAIFFIGLDQRRL